MLENVEIGEQKRRDDMYQAAKKKTGIYDDKYTIIYLSFLLVAS
jgi:U4/U6.U5 tri-snRNP-associated protein 1